MKERIKTLMRKLLSLSFLTWLSIFITKGILNQELDWAFYLFTFGVISIKILKELLVIIYTNNKSIN